MFIFYLIRFTFFILFAFVFLNSITVIKIPLNFPWSVMLIPIIFAWWFWEEICRKKLNYPKIIGFLLIIFICIQIIGDVFFLFDKLNWYDKMCHFLSGIIFGLISYFTLIFWNKKYNWKLTVNFFIIFSISIVITLFVICEIYEYFIDFLKNSNMIKDRFDTADDLLFGFIGVFLSVLSTVYFRKQKQNSKTNL